MKKNAIILAAGKGTRMNQEVPKCACKVNGKPMINHIVDACNEAGIENIIVVVGHQKEVIMALLEGQNVIFAYQEEQLGTAHACMVARDALKNVEGDTIILPGDMPLIGASNIAKLMNNHRQNHNTMTIMSTIFENPFSYGRIIRNEKNNVIGIIEEKEATAEQKLVKEINTGLYVADNQLLFDSLRKIDNNNSKKEYYLTDIVKILSKDHQVNALCVDYSYHLIGINDLETLKQVEELSKQPE